MCLYQYIYYQNDIFFFILKYSLYWQILTICKMTTFLPALINFIHMVKGNRTIFIPFYILAFKSLQKIIMTIIKCNWWITQMIFLSHVASSQFYTYWFYPAPCNDMIKGLSGLIAFESSLTNASFTSSDVSLFYH